MKIPLNSVSFVSLFKVKAFPFKNKDTWKPYFATRSQLLLYPIYLAPCLLCFEAICDRYFFKLNCFKQIGWFYHHIVSPPIRSVFYRKLHCDYKKLHCNYKKLHCDYRKLHCCLVLTALKSTSHSRVIFLCILLTVLWSAKIHQSHILSWYGNMVNLSNLV